MFQQGHASLAIVLFVMTLDFSKNPWVT